MKRIILYLPLLIIGASLAWVTVANSLPVWTKMDCQEFRVKAMEQNWYRSGKLTQEEWYDKLDKHCSSNNMYPSVCSYCDCVIKLNIGLAGISHGICPNCMEKAWKELDMLPDQEMLDAKKAFNERGKLFKVYLQRS